MRIRHADRWLIAVAVTLFACAEDRPPRGLEGLPAAHGLEVLDPPVQEAYQRLRAELIDALARRGYPDLAAAKYGQLGMWSQVYDYGEAARFCYQRAAALAPDDARWPYYQAQVEADDGQLDRAAELFDRVLELAPRYVPAVIRRGDVEIRRNVLEAARCTVRTPANTGCYGPSRKV